MNKVKDGSYYVVQSWMVKNLKLKGNDKDIYAIIYGFSQDGESAFTGSLQYLADWTNSTKQGVMKSLKNLLEKKLISKKEIYKNNIKFVEYYATKFNDTMQQSLIGCATKFNDTMQQSLTNNINDNIDNNINDNIDKKNIKKETILSEKEILFENFYKLYNNKIEITEQTKTTKGYNKLKEKFLKEVKTAKEEDILQGTRDYLSFIAFEHKRGFNRPLKDIQTFINQSGWEGDKGIPWNEVIQNNSKTYTQTQQHTQSKQNNQSKVDYDFDTKKDFDALFNN